MWNHTFGSDSLLPTRMGSRRNAVKTDQVDILTFAVLGDLEQVENAEEAGLAGYLRGDVGKANRVDRVDLDLSLFHAIARPYFYARLDPDADTAGDPPAANSFAKPLGEQHE